MRRPSLAGILLTTCATSATLPALPAQELSAPEIPAWRASDSHFHVLATRPEPRPTDIWRMAAEKEPMLAAMFPDQPAAGESVEPALQRDEIPAVNKKYMLAAMFQDESSARETVEPAIQMASGEEESVAPELKIEADQSNQVEPGLRIESPQPPPPPAPPENGLESDEDPSNETDATPALSPAGAEGGMTLNDAIGMALEANPTIAESTASIRRLQSEWNQTGFYPNPTAGYVASEIGNDGQEGQQGIYFGQTIVTADKLDWNRAVASGGVAFAQAQSEAQRLRVVTDTTIRFYEALGAQQLVEVAKKVRDNTKLGYEGTESLLKAGQVAPLELWQIEAQLGRATAELKQAKAQYDGARRRLAAVMGQPNLSRTKLVGKLERDSKNESFEAVWERLCAASPELQAASARVARTKAKIGREEAQSVPDIDAQNMVQYDTSTNTTVVGLQYTLAVPVFHQNEGAIGAAQAAHVRACRDYQRIELNLRDRLAQAFRDLETARAKVVTYREEVVPAADKSVDAIHKAKVQGGEFSSLDVLISLRTFTEARTGYVQALIDLRSAEARIDGLLLTGGLDEPVAPDPVGGAADLAGVPRAE